MSTVGMVVLAFGGVIYTAVVAAVAWSFGYNEGSEMGRSIGAAQATLNAITASRGSRG